jgi:hypothetical protein
MNILIVEDELVLSEGLSDPLPKSGSVSAYLSWPISGESKRNVEGRKSVH